MYFVVLTSRLLVSTRPAKMEMYNYCSVNYMKTNMMYMIISNFNDNTCLCEKSDFCLYFVSVDG